MLLSLQTAISQDATSWHPAAAANPSTFAMTGTGADWMALISSEHLWNTCLWCSDPRSAVNSLRLCPAENTRPFAASTMHRSSVSCWFSTIFLWILFIISNESELRVFSLSSRMVPTPSLQVYVDRYLSDTPAQWSCFYRIRVQVATFITFLSAFQCKNTYQKVAVAG